MCGLDEALIHNTAVVEISVILLGGEETSIHSHGKWIKSVWWGSGLKSCQVGGELKPI